MTCEVLPTQAATQTTLNVERILQRALVRFGPRLWVIGTILCTFTLCRSAMADMSTCSHASRTWISTLERDTGVRMVPTLCLPGRVVLSMEPQDVPPLEVEIGVGPGYAFRRVGLLRVSPLLQVDDFQSVPEAQRKAFERLIDWLGAHGDLVYLRDRVPPFPSRLVDLDGRTPILVILALPLWFVAFWRAKRISGRDYLLVLGLVGTALTLRLLLGRWGPLRINGVGPIWVIAAAREPAAVEGYGSGYSELFSWVTRITPGAPDYAIFFANAVLSAFAVGLAYAIGRTGGLSRALAGLVAGVLALDPLTTRTATSESYFVGIGALVAAAVLASSCAAIAVSRGARMQSTLLMLVAGLLCAQAARVHPIAWPPVALVPVAGLVACTRMGLPRRLLVAAACALIVLLVVAITSRDQLLLGLHRMLAGETFQPRLTPAGLVFAMLGVTTLFGVCGPRAGWLALVGGMYTSVWLLTRKSYAQSAVWQGSYDGLYLTWPLLAVIGSIPRRVRAWVSFTGASLVLVGMFAWRGPAALTATTTQQREYRWLRERIRELPGQCRVTHVAVFGKKNLFLPTYVSLPERHNDFVALDLRKPTSFPTGLAPRLCDYYLHSSLCSTREAAFACRNVEQRLFLDTVAESTFPAVEDNIGQGYEGQQVRVVISRILGMR